MPSAERVSRREGRERGRREGKGNRAGAGGRGGREGRREEGAGRRGEGGGFTGDEPRSHGNVSLRRRAESGPFRSLRAAARRLPPHSFVPRRASGRRMRTGSRAAYIRPEPGCPAECRRTVGEWRALRALLVYALPGRCELSRAELAGRSSCRATGGTEEVSGPGPVRAVLAAGERGEGEREGREAAVLARPVGRRLFRVRNGGPGAHRPNAEAAGAGYGGEGGWWGWWVWAKCRVGFWARSSPAPGVRRAPERRRCPVALIRAARRARTRARAPPRPRLPSCAH